MSKVIALDHLVLTVMDINRTVGFYREVLGMEREDFAAADGSKRVSLKFGNQKINLHEVGSEFDPKAFMATSGSADLCFLTKASLDTWLAKFENLGVKVELGPVARTGATGPITSIYIRDPDRNLIEISVRG